MENDGQWARGGELPGERLTRLSQASLRINESLDVARPCSARPLRGDRPAGREAL